jgi:hypothetical protein
MAEVDWTLLASRVDVLINEVASIKDEFRVQHAILMRLDTGQTAILTELHAMHTQMARVLDRLEQHDRQLTK